MSKCRYDVPMNNTLTPETDENLWDHGDEIDPSMRPDSNGNWVPTDFARKLERERDEALEELKSVKLQLGLWEDGNLISEETLGEIRLLEEQIKNALLKRNEALEQIATFAPLTHHDCFLYKDIMGNCIICKNKETK